MKNEITVTRNTVGYLRDPQRTRIPRNYKLNVRSFSNTFHVNLKNNNKIAANMNVYVSQNNSNRIVAEFEGQTHPNYRGKNLGTLIRGIVTKALLKSGVNYITHPLGTNTNNVIAKTISKKKGISISEARNNKNFVPISTRIVRKLGYTKNNRSNTTNIITPTMNLTKLNKIVRNITAAINIQRAYRRRPARTIRA